MANTAPLALRTDAIGIFAVLAILGFARLVVAPPGTLYDLVGPPIAIMWALTLFVFGVTGLVSTFVSRRYAIIGLGVEAVARAVLSVCLVTKGIAVLQFPQQRATSIVYFGIAALLAVGAVQIFRWLREQNRVISEVICATESNES